MLRRMTHTRSEGVDIQDAQGMTWFDPWLTCTHRVVVGYVESLTDHYARDRSRQRRLKDRDRDNLRAMLDALLANLAYAVVQAGEPPSPLTFRVAEAEPPSVLIRLRTARQKQSRYGRPGFAGLPAALDRLTQRPPGFFEIEKSHRKGQASRIIVGPEVAEAVHALGFGPGHFAYAEGFETIWLSKLERDYIGGTIEREWIDYKDTPQTIGYRAEMSRINAFLIKADLRMEPDGGAPVVTLMRPLRRFFNSPNGEQRFDLGGRLFGGWWESLPRSRRHAIRINGEPIAELDFASMFLRLAYLRVGAPLPEGDLYAMISGGPSDPHGRDQWRDGIKKIVSTMLFRTGPLTRVPPDIRKLLPRTRGATIRDAVLTAHPALASVFETGVGLQLMFTESQILVATLLRLIDRGIPALPMHDGLMTARSTAGAAMEAMAAASEEVVRVRLPITLKSP
jgi:hypothetical protein